AVCQVSAPMSFHMLVVSYSYRSPRYLPSFPTRRSSDLALPGFARWLAKTKRQDPSDAGRPKHVEIYVDYYLIPDPRLHGWRQVRSEEHTSELQSRENLVCRLLLEKKKNLKPQTDANYNT